MFDVVRSLILVISFLQVVLVCFSQDSISHNQQLRDGQTLVSAGGVFELGFFSPNGSNARYVGIKFKKYPFEKILWIANRNNPLTDSFGVATISNDGNLVVVDGSNSTIWSSNVSSASDQAVAVLLDSGKLELRENRSSEMVLWHSFDHPSDILLPGMRIGLNYRTGQTWYLSSWKNDSDPSPGNFVSVLDHQQLELPQVFFWNGSVKYFRSGQWNGRSFIGLPYMYRDYRSGYQLTVGNQGQELFFVYSPFNRSSPTLYHVTPSGLCNYMEWNIEYSEWSSFQVVPRGPCDIYNTCGIFGKCNNNGSPICQCLEGYEAKNADEWSWGNWTGGCVRKEKYQCERNTTSDQGKEDGFFRMTGIKTPDFARYTFARDREECEDLCLRNCTCLAYAYVDGIGCMFWVNNLSDIQEFSIGGEQLYIRLAHSELGEKTEVKAYIIVLIVVSAVLCLGLAAFILCRYTNLSGLWNRKLGDAGGRYILKDGITRSEGPEVQIISLNKLAAATENFSIANKLGEGGFGSVYKGRLSDGQEIAVKRLSRSSGQGIVEFKNEVELISKLQHRNLVKLLGFCTQGNEELLVYEYLPNKSLDSFIFGSNKMSMLSWDQRYNIIEGIARGLVYLHRDSRLKIIHRDLKTSNILLDNELNPKISDFGMARIFGGNQTMANTNRVVGTYGYMSPEYAMHGIFSDKSDVFSFGVLVLEIISGKRTTSFRYNGGVMNLLSYAYKLWTEGRAVDLLDQRLTDAYNPTQVSRCINIGLLCVQEDVNDRPNMATVVSMLCSDMTLPSPNSPGFSLLRRYRESDPLHFRNDHITFSGNVISLTTIEGR